MTDKEIIMNYVRNSIDIISDLTNHQKSLCNIGVNLGKLLCGVDENDNEITQNESIACIAKLHNEYHILHEIFDLINKLRDEVIDIMDNFNKQKKGEA